MHLRDASSLQIIRVDADVFASPSAQFTITVADSVSGVVIGVVTIPPSTLLSTMVRPGLGGVVLRSMGGGGGTFVSPVCCIHASCRLEFR